MTNKFIHHIYILAIVLLAKACTPTPAYREPATDGGTDGGDAAGANDAAPKQCPPSCPASTPVCDAEAGQCVVCTAANAGACTGTTPVCHADNTCYGCTAHNECGSDACLVDGSCADIRDVAYVDPKGSDNPTCDQATPCLTLSAGLATKRMYIKMAGETRGNVVILDQKVTILADPQAKLSSAGDSGPVITILGNSDVTIRDLEIAGATNTGFGHGVQMPTGNTAKVSLQHVAIRDNAVQGLDMDGGRLEMVNSTVADNRGIGIFAYGGYPSVTRSTIARNQRGGVSLYLLQSFSILNNVIVKNGLMTRVGGISVNPRVNPGNDDLNAIKFNTIVDNHSGDPFAETGGVACSGEGRTSSLETNLIFGNTGGAGNPQTSGAGCRNPTVIDPATSPGFRLSSADDYYLTNATPLTIRDVVDCDGITDDIGGPNQRPQSGKCDLGADEYRP